MSLSHHSCFLQHVHQSACAVVADGELALDEAGGAALLVDDEAGSIGKHGVEVSQVYVVGSTAAAAISALDDGFGQLEGFQIALLLCYEGIDAHHLGCVDEGALHAHRVVAAQVEHVAAAYELLGTHTVEDGLRVDALAHLEGDAGREVGLDGTRDDVGGGALGGDDHVDAHGARLLCDAGDGQLNLLAGRHDEVAILVDDHHDVGHELMSVLGVQLALGELLVVFLDVAHVGLHQQFVAGVHLHAEALQRAYHLAGVGDDGRLGLFGQSGEEVLVDVTVDAELHHLGVYEHNLQLGGVLLVEQRGEDGVQTYRFSLSRGTGHQQVGRLGQVEHEHLVGDGLAHGAGQVHRGLLEFLRVQNALHRHDALLGVGHLYADGALAGDGGYDAYAQRLQVQRDVVFQSTYLRDAHAWGGFQLIERDGGAYGGLDAADFDAKSAQHVHDAVLVGGLLGHVDVGLAVIVVVLQQVEGGVVVQLQVELGVVGLQHLVAHAHQVVAAGLLLFFCCRHVHAQLFAVGRFLLVVAAHGLHHLFVAYVHHQVVALELNGLCRRVVERGGVFHDGARGKCGLRVFLARAHRELHLVKNALGIQHLPNPFVGLGADVGEEQQCDDDEHGSQAGHAHKALYPAPHHQPMVAAKAEVAVAEEGRHKLGQRDGEPQHHQHQTHEPLQQRGLEGFHQSERQQEEEGGHQEGGQPEALLHEEVGRVGSQRAAGILELAVLVGHLAGVHILDDAHVGLSRGEERDEREHQTACQRKEQHAGEEAQPLVLEYLSSTRQAQCAHQRGAWFFGFCLVFSLFTHVCFRLYVISTAKLA